MERRSGAAAGSPVPPWTKATSTPLSGAFSKARFCTEPAVVTISSVMPFSANAAW